MRIRPLLGRAAVSVAVVGAILGFTAGVAEAKPSRCQVYVDRIDWAIANLMAADSDFTQTIWQSMLGAADAAADSAGC